MPIALGTQKEGSIIRPASFTGLFAFKPTHNAISTEGVKTVAFSIDTCGFSTTSPDDLQFLANVFALHPNNAPQASLSSRPRFALLKTPMWHMAGPSTIAAMEKAVQILERHGMEVDEVGLPFEFGNAASLWQTHETVVNGEARAALRVDYDRDKSKLHTEITDFVENRSAVTPEQHVQAIDKYASLRSSFDRFASSYSAILTPSVIDVAPLGLEYMEDPSFNFLWTVSVLWRRGRTCTDS